MARDRFEAIKAQFATHPLNPDYSDRWYPIRDFVDRFNKNRRENIFPSWRVVVDECMCAWRGKDLPHLSFIPRKPEPYGVEFKSIADGESGVLLTLEIQVMRLNYS